MTFQMKSIRILSAACGLMLASTLVAQDDVQTAESTAELMQLVRSATIIQSEATEERISTFEQEQARRQQLLQEEIAERGRQERLSEQREDTIAENELLIADKQDQLNERLGALRELFGHLQGAANDTAEYIDISIVSAQYPGRTDFIPNMIEKMAGGTELPTIAEIERMWAETMHEIVEGGNVSRFTAQVASPDGSLTQREVVRVGNFNLVSDGEYLSYNADNGRITELPAQPDRYTGGAADLQQSSTGLHRVGIDPTGSRGGTFLKAIIATPTLEEKWHQGGLVGYIITGLFGVAMLIVLYRLIDLMLIGGKVNKQLQSDQPMDNNPLGRVLAIQANNPSIDTETLELKLNEQILKERPRIEAWINIVKIIAAVAPLMGLLGTVTGMIVVFQGITLFGAGDVQGMAGGISQALVTTVLGLVVAIPTILAHTLLNSQAMRVIQILDEQAAGIVAEKAEAH